MRNQLRLFMSGREARAAKSRRLQKLDDPRSTEKRTRKGRARPVIATADVDAQRGGGVPRSSSRCVRQGQKRCIPGFPAHWSCREPNRRRPLRRPSVQTCYTGNVEVREHQVATELNEDSYSFGRKLHTSSHGHTQYRCSQRNPASNE